MNIKIYCNCQLLFKLIWNIKLLNPLANLFFLIILINSELNNYDFDENLVPEVSDVDSII